MVRTRRRRRMSTTARWTERATSTGGWCSRSTTSLQSRCWWSRRRSTSTASPRRRSTWRLASQCRSGTTTSSVPTTSLVRAQRERGVAIVYHPSFLVAVVCLSSPLPPFALFHTPLSLSSFSLLCHTLLSFCFLHLSPFLPPPLSPSPSPLSLSLSPSPSPYPSPYPSQPLPPPNSFPFLNPPPSFPPAPQEPLIST